jgi:hypothetical protein
MILKGKNLSNQVKTCPTAILSTETPKQAGLELNPSLCSKRLVTIQLSHGRAPTRYNYDWHLDNKLQGPVTGKGIFGAINHKN